MKHFSVFLVLIFLSVPAAAQVPSVIENIRFPVWAEVDAYPGLGKAFEEDVLDMDGDSDSSEEAGFSLQEEPASGEYAYAISRIKELSPFIIEGMVYGWDFVYTPSDNTRNVEEYFELTVKEPLGADEMRISYSSVWIQDNKFNCWVDYSRSAYQVQNYYLWASIQHPVIQGRGYGDIDRGFDGIRDAAEEAVKNAVRTYYRNLIKNKPKEITGSVLVRRIPTIGISSGRYVINLDFFLECGKIKEYTNF